MSCGLNPSTTQLHPETLCWPNLCLTFVSSRLLFVCKCMRAQVVDERLLLPMPIYKQCLEISVLLKIWLHHQQRNIKCLLCKCFFLSKALGAKCATHVNQPIIECNLTNFNYTCNHSSCVYFDCGWTLYSEQWLVTHFFIIYKTLSRKHYAIGCKHELRFFWALYYQKLLDFTGY